MRLRFGIIEHVTVSLVPLMLSTKESRRTVASQTLFRGLEIVDAVANGYVLLTSIAEHTGINVSTAHRLASALVKTGYLEFEPRKGYKLGPRLIELGFQAYRQSDLIRLAHGDLQSLSRQTMDTVHLARLDGVEVVYLDKVEGSRPVEVRSYVGGRKPICSTGVGKALILDESEEQWCAHYAREKSMDLVSLPIGTWLHGMHTAVKAGTTLDLSENQSRICCVAAPIRNGVGKIIAAVSVTSTADYTDDARLLELAPLVNGVARQISLKLGQLPG